MVAVAAGEASFVYQWQWQPMSNGTWANLVVGQNLGFGGALIVDAANVHSSTVQLTPLTDYENYVSRAFRCVATNVNTGGSVASSQAVLTPLAICCNSIDFNNDTSTFDPIDIDAFLSVYGEGPCIPSIATCDDIDFNNDNSTFDPCDIDSFLLVFSEGPCTLCGQ